MGSGAREHAIVKALARDPDVAEVHCGPGNVGIAADAAIHTLDVGDVSAIVELASRLTVDLVVIGPEAPLVSGAADALRDAGIACFGPSAAAARLEGSKAFAKGIMGASAVPTAEAIVCSDMVTVASALDRLGPRHVVKDDGLAGGKGVVVTDEREEALEHAARCFAKAQGRVLVEEYLDGPEVSLFVVTDGLTAMPLLPAQDFKRMADGDSGPNTGGMGAYTPLEWAPAGLVPRVMETVTEPVLDAMRRRGHPFVGLLYIGLALSPAGPRVVEFNVRFGDPETQSILALLETGLGGLLHSAAIGDLDQVDQLAWTEGCAVTVVLAASGYPGSPCTGGIVSGLAAAAADPQVTVLHAGTKSGPNGEILSAGGRVLAVVGTGAHLASARDAAYSGIAKISLAGSHYRTDIASRAVTGDIVRGAAYE